MVYIAIIFGSMVSICLRLLLPLPRKLENDCLMGKPRHFCLYYLFEFDDEHSNIQLLSSENQLNRMILIFPSNSLF